MVQYRSRRSRCLGRVIVSVVIVVAAAACSGATTLPVASTCPGWILTYAVFKALSRESDAGLLFDNRRTYVIVTASTIGGLRGWLCNPTVDFASYSAMRRAFDDGSIPAGIVAVLYDNEDWTKTPVPERRNPAAYEELAAALVHSHHMVFITSPAADLVHVLDPNGSGTEFRLYLELDIAGTAARYADVLDIQAQGEEAAIGDYESFVKQATAQARAANPKVIVYAGLSTARAPHAADAMIAAIAATRHAVSGYWLNVVGSGLNGSSAISAARQVVRAVTAGLRST